MISYEVSIGLVIIGVIISTGSMNFGAIVAAQILIMEFWLVLVAHFQCYFYFLSLLWPKQIGHHLIFQRLNRSW